MSAPDPIQTMANRLLACLTVAAQAAADPPKNFGFLPGAQANEDMSIYNDLCCEGTAYVRWSALFPSSTFPAPDAGQANCEPVAWASIWELGIMRCAPTGSAEFTPTFGEWNSANTQHLIDQATLRSAVITFKEQFASGANDAGVLIGVGLPVGPQGGCLVQTLPVTIQVIECGLLTSIGG